MILNDEQLGASRATLQKLQNGLKQVFDIYNSNRLESDNLRVNALASQINELSAEIEAYEKLVRGQITPATLTSHNLPEVLIEYRIHQGLTQEQFAKILGISTMEYFRMEADKFHGVSGKVLDIIKSSLDVKELIDDDISVHVENELNLEKFPLNEMHRRGWFSTDHSIDLISSAQSFFSSFAGHKTISALHRKKARSGSEINEEALFSWQVRILQLAKRMEQNLDKMAVDWGHGWVGQLVKLSKEKNGPVLARELLWSKGIALVIEPHLDGTHLDGAAMISDSNLPIIGMTLRHDRVDAFWFTLLHELGHILLHLSQNNEFDFFDEEEDEPDELENEANTFALNNLISPEQWDTCISRFIRTSEAITNDAEMLSIHPAIIAGRIRYEKAEWNKFDELLGRNTVRWMFEV